MDNNTNLKIGVLSRNGAEQQLRKHLKTMSVITDTLTRDKKPIFPDLLDAITLILDRDIYVNLSPYDYTSGNVQSVFTSRVRVNLEKVDAFARKVNQHLPKDADVKLVLDRLADFNEAVTTVVSLDGTNGYQANSRFSGLKTENFWQLNVLLRAPKVECLAHMVDFGILRIAIEGLKNNCTINI